MNNTIDTYTNSIYEYDLIVAGIDVTLEDLQKEFVYRGSGKELDTQITDFPATTTMVIRKSDDRACELVKLNRIESKDKTKQSKMLWIVNTTSHEALHYLLDLCYTIYENVNNECQEPFAYIQGWAAECIYKTWTKKNDTIQKRKPTKRQ